MPPPWSPADSVISSAAFRASRPGLDRQGGISRLEPLVVRQCLADSP
ncbi:hypothetical protein [Streptomyces sp. NPDC006267]